MRPGVPGVDAVIFKYCGLCFSSLCFDHQRLVAVFLGPECTCHIFRAFHDTAALVVEAEDGGHHISAGAALQRGGNFLLIADAPGGRASPRAKSGRKEKPRRISAPASIRARQRGRFALWSEDSCLLGIPGCEAVLSDKGLLFHPRLCGKRSRFIVEVSNLIPLVCRKGGQWRRWKVFKGNQSGLCLQGQFQLLWQVFPPFHRPPQNTQAGFSGQIIFGWDVLLQNRR